MTKDNPDIIGALNKVSDYIAKTTGKAATQEELIDALGRYFVLQEIKDHIELKRDGFIDEE